MVCNNKNNIKADRSEYIDIIKAFAIIFVVFGHCIQYGSGNEFFINMKYFDNVAFKAIYSFHMPIFMLVSGYLFKYSVQKRSAWELIIHKIKTLLIPISLWSLIPFAYSFADLLRSGKRITFFSACKMYAFTALTNLWFLWAIFWCSIVVVLVNKLLRDSIIAYIAIFLLTFIVPDDFKSYLYKFMYPYFVLGYLYNKYGLGERFRRIYSSPAFLIACAAVFAALLTQYNYESYIYTTGYYLFSGEPLKMLYTDVYRFIIGLVGSIFVMILIAKVNKYILPSIKRFFAFIGQNSLGIYIISDWIFLHILNKITYSFSDINYFVAIIETVIIAAVSLLMTCLIKKIRILNFLLLGGRI